jgi:putative intracellular protease/amidase
MIRKSWIAVLAVAIWTSPVGSSDSRAADSAGSPHPVLMVISNQDFWYQEYADVRHELRKHGLSTVIAAATTDRAISQGNGRSATVKPDIALADADADDYSAIIFVGGWGASSYQYDFPGDYHNYRRDPAVVASVNSLIGDFFRQRKPVSATCHGVTVLAWARVDGESPIKGRLVAAWAGGGPGFQFDGQLYPDSTVPVRWQIEANGGIMPLSAAIGDPLTSRDDVVIDGRIITAENHFAAAAFARLLANEVTSRKRS